MTLLERLFEIELVGDAGSERVWQDLAYDNGIAFEVISDERAEELRVSRARGDVRQVPIVDAMPRSPKLVRCGGLNAITPSVGGDFKGWMAANVARLWRATGSTLFEYVTKKRVRRLIRNSFGEPIGYGWELSTVRRKQRWETRDYVDLAIGDSPAHLSGFGSGPDGRTKVRNVAAPRSWPTAGAPAPMNMQLDLNGRRR